MMKDVIGLSKPLVCLLWLTACSDSHMSGESPDSAMSDNGSNIAQNGAQDFGYFRDILEAGGLPGPETIDDVGFFNEHYIDLPDPDCGEDVCIHGRLGQMGNMINGGDCTVVMMGMNTPINAADLERPPLNLSLVIDTSGSMGGDNIAYVKSGLTMLVENLEPDDHVTLIEFNTNARVVAQGTGADSDDLFLAVAGLSAGGGTNIFAGLELGYDSLDLFEGEGFEDRILLLSDGVATEGITAQEMIVGLASAHSEDEAILTTIGMGEEFDITLMEELAQTGNGSFYYLEDPSAVEEVFVEEVTSFLVPIAHDAEIVVEVEAGWEVRNVYGTEDFTFVDDRAAIVIDTLQIAGRTSDSDNSSGRRGGNGAMILELVPGSEAEAGGVGTIDFTYQDVDSEEVVQDVTNISSPLDPELIEEGQSYFEDDPVAKAFVMLNIYVGFELATVDVQQGNFDNALATLQALCGSVEGWLEEHPDEDIEDDLMYIDMFIENLVAAGAGQEGEEADPWPSD